MPRKYFPFYFTFREAGRTMKPKQRAAFYEAIIEYAATGVEPKLTSNYYGCWAVVKPMLDAAKAHYDAGTKGGRPSKSDSFGFLNSETYGLHKEKEKEKEKENSGPTAPPAAVAPHKGALGGSTVLGSSLDGGDRDAATDEARRKFFESLKRPEWPAAEAAPPDVEKEE